MTAMPATFAASLRGVEYPTLLLAIAIYGGLALLTLFHSFVPWPLLALFGGYFVAWHGSLQHEVVHGHPTPWPLLNRLLVLPSPWLVLPFDLYRDSHLRHHRNEWLTDPLEDPESYYVTAATWERIGAPGRGFLRVYNCLLGRLLLAPLVITARSFSELGAGLLRGDLKLLAAWALHLVGAGLVLYWVLMIAGMSLWAYLLFFVYPGLSLTSLRSFAEHRAATQVAERTATLKAEAPLALLFLNNNLHSVHHAQPGLPWYSIPAAWRATRPEEAPVAGESIEGYRTLLARYLLSPKEHPLHPAERRGPAYETAPNTRPDNQR